VPGWSPPWTWPVGCRGVAGCIRACHLPARPCRSASSTGTGSEHSILSEAGAPGQAGWAGDSPSPLRLRQGRSAPSAQGALGAGTAGGAGAIPSCRRPSLRSRHAEQLDRVTLTPSDDPTLDCLPVSVRDLVQGRHRPFRAASSGARPVQPSGYRGRCQRIGCGVEQNRSHVEVFLPRVRAQDEDPEDHYRGSDGADDQDGQSLDGGCSPERRWRASATTRTVTRSRAARGPGDAERPRGVHPRRGGERTVAAQLGCAQVTVGKWRARFVEQRSTHRTGRTYSEQWAEPTTRNISAGPDNVTTPSSVTQRCRAR